MFRFVALFALVSVALAEPEADPQVFYATHGVLPYANPYMYAHHGVVKPVEYKVAAPSVHTFPGYPAVVDPHATTGAGQDTNAVKIAKAAHLNAKASAELYHKTKYVAPAVYSAYPYHVYSVANPFVKHVVTKREAEADSDAQVYYATHGVLPYANPSMYAHHGVVKPVEYKVATPSGTGYTTGYVPTVTGYTGYTGYPYTYTYPTTATNVIGKHEAEADADPQFSHPATTYAGVTRGVYGHTVGYVPTAAGYTGYTTPYNYVYYGKK